MARPDTQIPAVTLYSSQNEIKSSFDIATEQLVEEVSICNKYATDYFLSENNYEIIFRHHPRFNVDNAPNININYDII